MTAFNRVPRKDYLAAPPLDQQGVNIIKIVVSAIIVLVVVIGSVAGIGYVQASTANAQVNGDVKAVSEFMESQHAAEKKYPVIPLSNNDALSEAGFSLSLTGDNRVQTVSEKDSWQAALQSESLKTAGDNSWFCFSKEDTAAGDPVAKIGDCLEGVEEPTDKPDEEPSPEPSESATAAPEASEEPEEEPTKEPKAKPTSSPTAEAEEDAIKISVASTATCYVTDTAYCAGENRSGELGTGETGQPEATPIKVVGDLTFTEIAPGAGFSCGIAGGDAYCWGQDNYGQLGDGAETRENRYVPAKVAGDFSFTSLTTGDGFVCGIVSGTQQVACWGKEYSSAPTLIPSKDRFTALSAGEQHVCGIVVSEDAYCWGANGSGELGNETTDSSFVPVRVTAGTGKGFTDISAGYQHTCAIMEKDAWCWGDNYSGQLGAETDGSREPVKVSGNLSLTSIYAGKTHSCGVTFNGEAYCWGANYRGSLGTGSTDETGSTPVAVFSEDKFKALAIGDTHTCGVTDKDSFYCWGQNDSGQLGNGGFSDASYPMEMTKK